MAQLDLGLLQLLAQFCYHLHQVDQGRSVNHHQTFLKLILIYLSILMLHHPHKNNKTLPLKTQILTLLIILSELTMHGKISLGRFLLIAPINFFNLFFRYFKLHSLYIILCFQCTHNETFKKHTCKLGQF